MNAELKSKPILFSGEMVRAIIEGRKTQTRRVLSYQPDEGEEVYGPELYEPEVVGRDGELEPGKEEFGVYGSDWSLKSPYGQPGDLLWVRETWRAEELESGLDGIRFRADGKFVAIENTQAAADAWCDANKNQDLWRKNQWKPSIFMPRWASRITLEVVNVRMERVQDITNEDSRAEGVSGLSDAEFYKKFGEPYYVGEFAALWKKINEKRGFGWYVNPWVWVVEFMVEKILRSAQNDINEVKDASAD